MIGRMTTALLALSLSVLASAQKRAFTVDDVFRVKAPAGVTLSPDGNMLSFSLSETDFKKGSSASDVYVMNKDGQGLRRLTEGGKSFSPLWSSDGKTMFYLSLAPDNTMQVFRHDIQTGKGTQITSYALGVADVKISPDNNLIAFTAEVYPDLDDPDGKANAATDRKRVEGPVQAILADKLPFRHWDTYSDGKYSHIIVYDISRQTYTDVTKGEYQSPAYMQSTDGFAFSPDSKEICFVSNRTEHTESNTNCDLWTVSVTGGEPVCITSDNKAWDGSPQYSPDGKYIAYRMQTVEGYESDRFRLAIYDRKSGEKKVITDSYDNWVEDYQWADNSKSIYFMGQVPGSVSIFKVDLAGRISTVMNNDIAVSSFAADKKGNIYFTASTTDKPHAIYCTSGRKGDKPRQLTFFNKQLEDEVDFRPCEKRWVTGADGDSVEYFIVKPHGFREGVKYPLVINVHGGPQMEWMNSYRADYQIYPGAGYVLAYPNPHGSTGYGQKFTLGITGSWGGRPFEDIMKVTDDLETLDYVDADRIGVMGWSYGGYMMNWLQAKTKRYKCLASMMGVYDMNSMWGTTEELWFPEFEFNGQPWNSDLYNMYSPSAYAKDFSTPTLIMTGERDYRVPYLQSVQYFTTLQKRGIPSRLIILKNDGHWPSNAKSMSLYYVSHLDWFHKYLGGSPAPYDVEKMIRNNAW